MSARTQEHLDTFWELIDEILNAGLFVLIGLEGLILTFHGQYFLAALIIFPCCSRDASVEHETLLEAVIEQE